MHRPTYTPSNFTCGKQELTDAEEILKKEGSGKIPKGLSKEVRKAIYVMRSLCYDVGICVDECHENILSILYEKLKESDTFEHQWIAEWGGKIMGFEEDKYLPLEALDHPYYVKTVDLDGTIKYINEPGAKMYGYENPKDLVGKNISLFNQGLGKVYEHIIKTIKAGEVWKGKMEEKDSQGKTNYVEKRIKPIVDEKGNICGFTEFGHDNTYDTIHHQVVQDAMHKKLKVAEDNSCKDSLTGLLNHGSLICKLKNKIKKSNRSSDPFSLIFCDLDNFKEVNDDLGHPFGDEVIKKVAEVISSTIRGSDLVYRCGGEEFAIILPGTLLEKGEIIAEKIRMAVSEISIKRGVKCKKSGEITISLGIEEFKKGDSYSSFLNRVDNALYGAKKNGRNQVCKYSKNNNM